MNNLERNDICWFPWMIGRLYPNCLGFCCHTDRASMVFPHYQGPWKDVQIFRNWWHGPKMNESRRITIEKGSSLSCPHMCRFNRDPSPIQSLKDRINYLKTIKETKSLDMLIEDIQNGTGSVRSDPLSLIISIGFKCASKCIFCLQHFSIEHEKATARGLSYEELKTPMQMITDDTYTVHFIGGELFDFKDSFLEQISKKIEKHNAKGETTTNLIGMTLDRYSKYIHNCFHEITWSTSTIDRNKYKEIHGVDKWDIVKNNLKNIKREFGKDHQVRICALCVMQHNYRKLDEIIEFCAEHGVDSINLIPVEPRRLVAENIGGYSMSHPKNLNLFLEEWDELYCRYTNLARQCNVKLDGCDSTRYLVQVYAKKYW